jgi:hypothetical protein
MWSFQTISHSEFNKLAELFVLTDDGLPCKKHIKPFLVENYVTPLSLAYWFMDDGTYHQDQYGNRQYYFSTQGFTKEDCQRLCDALDSKFQIQANVHKDKNYWRLYIRRESKELFVKSISPYLLSDFFYKISS